MRRKRSELPPDQRTHKGGAVFEDSYVSDESSNVAVFEEVASSASLMSEWWKITAKKMREGKKRGASLSEATSGMCC